jgi:hypothetical protein
MVSKYIQKLTVTGDRSSVDVGLMIIGLENIFSFAVVAVDLKIC